VKVFDLVCTAGHRFEGWFASSEAFAAQCEASAVSCPLCDSTTIRRAPSAPRLNFGSEAAPIQVDAATRDPRAVFLDGLRRLIAKTEDVGSRFAEEARRIHYDEVPPRAIRGTATDHERRELEDEGIETLSIPLPAALTEPLQ
jgi:hypothetical protein